MINIKKTTAMAFLLCLAVLGYSQGKKTIRDKGIASRTVQEYFIEEGMDEPVTESIEKYNEKGDLIELQEFDRRGEVKKWEKYAYDEEGELVEEVFMDTRGRVERTEKTTYEEGLKVEKHYFNNRGKLFKKKVYEYEYHQ